MTHARPDLAATIERLCAPGVLPGSGDSRPEVVQTHISVVFLTADRAYKLKKPVDFGFLDFSSPEKRARFCREELRLNRRLAADWYLGLSPLWFREDGTIDVAEPSPSPAPSHEVLLVMRRLPRDRMMDALLAQGAVTTLHVERLARIVAAFHRDAEAGAGVLCFGTREVVGELALENFDQTKTFCGTLFEDETHATMRRRVAAFLETHERLFAQRLAAGRIRDGHGDLHSPNVCLVGDDPVVYDCIEFSPKYRAVDVASDVGFLAMDLEHRGHHELARVFLAAYIEESEDDLLPALLPFYMSYRAMVRAKIAALTSAATEVPVDVRERAADEARSLFALAARYTTGLVPPALVMIGGPTGSGRHTIAAELERRAGMAALESAKLRVSLAREQDANGDPVAVAEATYSDAMTKATNQALGRQARARLERGETALVVGNFFAREERGALCEAAADAGLPVLYVDIEATDEEIAERMGKKAWEAIPDAHHRARRAAEPPDEVPANRRMRLGIVRDGVHSAEMILARLREMGGAP